jgi:hypothetical protein
MNYEELSLEEKAAIEVALFRDSRTLDVLRRILGDFSDSKLRRRLYAGQELLIKKGLLSANNAYEFTDLAFTLIPSEKLLKSFQAKQSELNNRQDRINDIERKLNSLDTAVKGLANEKEKLGQEIDSFKLIAQTLDAFSFLGIDENWVSALISSTVLEFSLKNKLEKLGCPASEVPHHDFSALVKKFNDFNGKSGGRYDGLFDLDAIRGTRNKLVHEGNKRQISAEEANAILTTAMHTVRNIGN